MQHEAGLECFHRPIKPEEYHDLELLREIMEESAPYHPNTTIRTYHSITRGWIINEILRQADPRGRTIGKFARDEIFTPLGVEFYIGNLPEHLESRVSPMVAYPIPHMVIKTVVPWLIGNIFPRFPQGDPFLANLLTLAMDKNSGLTRGSVGAFVYDQTPTWFNTRQARLGEIPSANGITNAHSMGKIGAALANGGEFEGKRIISKKALDLAYSSLDPRLDSAFGHNSTLTRNGWGVFDEGPWRGFKGWAGWGGSLFLWNEEKQLALAFTVTAMELGLLGDTRSVAILEALNSLV